jgi:WD40 repeat protein
LTIHWLTKQVKDVTSPKPPTRGPKGAAPASREESSDARDSKATPQGATIDAAVIPDAPPDTPQPSIPGYDILGVLGRGGMGVVYKAMQQRLKRVVALKVIRIDTQGPDSTVIKRFQREALAAAQLFHPNVVVVFDSDQVGDTYFIAMEYVAGVDLYHLVKDGGPLDIPRACDYIRQAAQGLQHAGERGLVHRDIKPSNLLVTEAPGPTTHPFGLVKILDMGLALARDLPNAQSVDCTQAGALMGTPDYIAPEQAMDSHAVDIRSDLYSLGCTFYYLLTGKPPFGELALMKKLLMHQTGEARPVEELRPDAPPGLSVILRKLMAKHPEHRYQTPAELIDALDALGFPGPKLSGTMRKRDSVVMLSRAVPATPHRTTDSTIETAAALSATKRVEPRQDGNQAERIAVLEGHRGWVTSLAFAPDRKRLASGGVDGRIRLWTMSSSKGRDSELPCVHVAEIGALAISPDNRYLASGPGSLGCAISLWDNSTEEPSVTTNIPCQETTIVTLVYSASSRFLAGAGSDAIVRVWDEKAPGKPVVLKGHGATVNTLAFASDEQTVASGSQDGTVRLWNTSNFWSKKQGVLDGNWGPVRTVAFSPDSKTLALGCLDQTIRLWDVSEPTPEERFVLTGHAGVPRLVYFNRDGATLLSVCDGGRIILWNLATNAVGREWRLPRADVYNSVAFTHDGRYLAAGNSDGQVYLYRLYPRRDTKHD